MEGLQGLSPCQLSYSATVEWDVFHANREVKEQIVTMDQENRVTQHRERRWDSLGGSCGCDLGGTQEQGGQGTQVCFQ